MGRKDSKHEENEGKEEEEEEVVVEEQQEQEERGGEEGEVEREGEREEGGKKEERKREKNKNKTKNKNKKVDEKEKKEEQIINEMEARVTYYLFSHRKHTALVLSCMHNHLALPNNAVKHAYPSISPSQVHPLPNQLTTKLHTPWIKLTCTQSRKV